MSKFTEVPYNILESYIILQKPYGHINASPSGVSKAIITRKHITAKGGFGVDLFVNQDKSYYKLKCRSISGYPVDNQFLFHLETSSYRNSDINFAELDDFVGGDVYFRKESLFYDFIDHFIYRYTTEIPLDTWIISHNLYGIKNNITPDDIMVFCYDLQGNFINDAEVTIVNNNSLIIEFSENHSGNAFIFSTNKLQKYYSNTNREYIYFGKLYLSETTFSITYYGMKDYALDALPVNNRTDNNKELFKQFFDYIYNNIYYQIRDIHTLSDPYEVDYNYLYYIALMYKMILLENITEDKQREYVSSLPYLLKRCGTYTALYGMWKLLMDNSTNLLNVYERWHDWNIPSDIPLPYFLDYPYYDMPLYLIRSGSQLISTDRYIFTQSTASSKWRVEHNLKDYNLFVQCFDTDGNMIWPSSYEFVSDTLTNLNFDTNVTGYAYFALADITVPQLTDNTLWSINHALNSMYVLTETIVANGSESIIFPLSVTLDSVNNYTIRFASAQSGTALTSYSDYTHVQTVASIEWTIQHNFGAKDIQVQFYDSTNMVVYPINIQLFEDSCVATFETPVAGNAVVKSFSLTGNVNDPNYNKEFGIYYNYDVDEYALSPHYRVEMDLTNEPLSDDYILDSITYNTLVSGWENLRPVSRFAHYSILMAPVSNFTGVYVGLYDPKYTAKMSTLCTIAKGALTSDNTYGLYKVTPSTTWRINHNLGTLFTIVQCYDTDGYKIEFESVTVKDENNIVVHFNEPSNGYVYVLKVDPELYPSSDYVHEQLSPSASWTVTHSLSGGYQLVQLDSAANLDYVTFMPGSVTVIDDNTYLVSTETTPASAGFITSGFAVTKLREYIYTQTDASSTWLITHDFGVKAVIVNLYNFDDEMIQPESIYIINDNSCRITFEEATSGYAVLKGVDLISIDINTEVAKLSYVKIGTGTSGVKYNTDLNVLENPAGGLWSVTRSSDNIYHYIRATIEYPISDIEITEMGLFNSEDNMIFYSVCSPIYLKVGSMFTVIFRLEK